MAKYLLILLFLSPINTFAENVVAVLDLKFISDTEKTSTSICFEDETTECFSWASFYLYEAKIKKVLSGELSSKKFKVIYGRHALKKKILKELLLH